MSSRSILGVEFLIGVQSTTLLNTAINNDPAGLINKYKIKGSPKHEMGSGDLEWFITRMSAKRATPGLTLPKDRRI